MARNGSDGGAPESQGVSATNGAVDLRALVLSPLKGLGSIWAAYPGLTPGATVCRPLRGLVQAPQPLLTISNFLGTVGVPRFARDDDKKADAEC
jgi:hypothetical protein